MSKLSFSSSKFSKFITSKGFYVAIAVCLVGAGAATWLAVDRTITGIEKNNNQIIQNENRFNEFPQLEEAEKKQEGVTAPKPSAPSSSSSTQSSSSAPELKRTEPSEQPAASLQLPTLAYALPIKGDIINQYSNGELVKNVTLGDWRTHDGVDIYADKGVEVLAAADGVVTGIKNDPLWGTIVTIDHADGKQSIYCGLDKTVPVKVGENVLVRQVIGKLDGVPCEISDENHLHFSMKQGGAWIDPLSVMAKVLG